MLCSQCPRGCKATREETWGGGFCRQGTLPRVARAAPHFWEEPPVSGEMGSGAVFFSGCSLGCVYCQNSAISSGGAGEIVSAARLSEIYAELIDRGVHNINLVTASHFIDAVEESLKDGLTVPVVWNSSGYESLETLRRLQGKVQVYLPDMKYAVSQTAARYSLAPDYHRWQKRPYWRCTVSGDHI